VHFRDVRGEATRFHETFHDEGKTDMFAAMRTYCSLGLNVVVRPDHVPVVQGADTSAEEGYTMLGRLFAVGFMRGLITAAKREL